MNTTLRGEMELGGSGREPRPRGRLRRWWRDASLRRKLLSVALVAMLACVPPMVVAFTLAVRVSDVRAATRHTEQTAARLADLQDVLNEADLAVSEFVTLAFSGPRYVEDYERAAGAVPGLLVQIRDDLDGSLADEMADLEAAVDRELATMSVLIDYDTSGTSEAAPPADEPERSGGPPDLLQQLADYAQMVDAGHGASERVQALVADRLAAERADNERLHSLLRWSVTAGWVVAVAIILGGISFVAGGIVRRVELLVQNGRRFVRGEPLEPSPPSKDEIGRLTDAILVVSELLDQRRREAVAANHAKDEFISRVSHELRTPLTAVIGFGEVLVDDPDLTEGDRPRRVVTAGQDVLTLINDLLDVSKLDAGHLAVTVGLVRPHEIVEHAVTLVQSLPGSRSVGIDLHRPEDDLVALADPQRLERVLLNLLSAAVESSPEGGQIDVGVARRDDGSVRIGVAGVGTGDGMTPEHLARLFGPDGGLDPGDGDMAGSDIRLTLTKRLVEAMDGAIGVEGAAGAGTTLWVDLPAAAPEELPVDGAATSEAGPVGEPTGPAPTGSGPGRSPGRLRQRWLDLSVRRKLQAVAVVALLACLPPMVAALVLVRQVDDAQGSASVTQRVDDDLAGVEDALADAVIAARSATILRNFTSSDVVEEYEETAVRVTAELATLREGAPAWLAAPVRETEAAVGRELDELSRLVAYSGPLPNFDTLTDEQVATFRPEQLVEQGIATNEARVAGDRSLQGLEDRVAGRLASQRARIDRLQSLLGWLVVVGWVAALIAILAATSLVASGMVRRIERLSRNSQRLLLGEPLEASPPSEDEIGRLTTGILAVGELLDQRRREAVVANRAKDQFLSRISHALRTPITAVVGHGQALESDESLSPDGREAARYIVDGGRHLLGLIDDLLDASRFDADHLAVVIGPVRARRVTEDAVALVRSLAESRGIDIELHRPEDDVVVAADPQRLKQVLLNLLSNAIKYNRERGRVNVDVAPRGDTIRISVGDTGHGIPAEGLARLFQPFERLDAAHGDIEGSGIGLALSKRLVDAMDGTIGVDSTVGTGTTFWVELPATEADESPHPLATTVAAV